METETSKIEDILPTNLITLIGKQAIRTGWRLPKGCNVIISDKTAPYYLTEGQDGSPAPAVHDQDAEDVARDLDEDAQEEVGVGIARKAGGGKW